MDLLVLRIIVPLDILFICSTLDFRWVTFQRYYFYYVAVFHLHLLCSYPALEGMCLNIRTFESFDYGGAHAWEEWDWGFGICGLFP